MVTFIEKYFKVLIMLLLLIFCFLLYASWTNGRYMVCSAYDGLNTETFVLDTKTGRLWRRDFNGSMELGTCQSPIVKYVKSKKIKYQEIK